MRERAVAPVLTHKAVHVKERALRPRIIMHERVQQRCMDTRGIRCLTTSKLSDAVTELLNSNAGPRDRAQARSSHGPAAPAKWRPQQACQH